ncbi:MAG: uncharacterized protein QOH61_2100 [Chloroflexota bacterium]|jgi:uncharacterized OB-fold protein|nr:uncharacterized protein [Chloroflexota bacterium]
MNAATGLSADPAEAVLPDVTDLNRPFWDGCAAHELRLQACRPCGHIRYPISEVCPRCLSADYDWRPMSGDGEILTWVVFQRGYQPTWAPLVPYNVVLVQLAEGPRMFGNVLPLGRTDLRIGMPLRVAFEDARGGVTVPRWTTVSEGSAVA